MRSRRPSCFSRRTTPAMLPARSCSSTAVSRKSKGDRGPTGGMPDGGGMGRPRGGGMSGGGGGRFPGGGGGGRFPGGGGGGGMGIPGGGGPEIPKEVVMQMALRAAIPKTSYNLDGKETVVELPDPPTTEGRPALQGGWAPRRSSSISQKRPERECDAAMSKPCLKREGSN